MQLFAVLTVLGVHQHKKMNMMTHHVSQNITRKMLLLSGMFLLLNFSVFAGQPKGEDARSTLIHKVERIVGSLRMSEVENGNGLVEIEFKVDENGYVELLSVSSSNNELESRIRERLDGRQLFIPGSELSEASGLYSLRARYKDPRHTRAGSK